jgi:hypothetical protein
MITLLTAEYALALEDKASSTIIMFNLGKASRIAGSKRLLALRSQSFLLSPSWRVIASGKNGNTLDLSGWTITAPSN